MMTNNDNTLDNSNEEEEKDHTIQNDTRHDALVQATLTNAEDLLNQTECDLTSSQEYKIGKMVQQNQDLKDAVTALKTQIDELVQRKDMSCFMCREELKLVKRKSHVDLEKANEDYHEKLDELGELLTGKNLKNKKGQHFIICERAEYEDLHDRLRESSEEVVRLNNSLKANEDTKAKLESKLAGTESKLTEVQIVKTELEDKLESVQIDLKDSGNSDRWLGKIRSGKTSDGFSGEETLAPRKQEEYREKIKSMKRKNFRMKEEVAAKDAHIANLEELLMVMKEQRKHYLNMIQENEYNPLGRTY